MWGGEDLSSTVCSESALDPDLKTSLCSHVLLGFRLEEQPRIDNSVKTGIGFMVGGPVGGLRVTM